MAPVVGRVSVGTWLTRVMTCVLVAAAVSVPFAASARAAAPDTLEILVTRDQFASDLGTPGGFCWNKDTNDFYTCVFGSGMGLRRYDVDADEDYTYAIAYDLNLFHLSEDLYMGISDPDRVWGTPRTMAISLNPAPITLTFPDPNDPADPNRSITVNYGAGELAYVVNYSPDVVEWGWPKPEWTKTIFRWDLRELFSYTDEQPDYNNASDSGYLIGAYNRVDFNDAFSVVCTAKDFYDASGRTYGPRPYVGHAFGWSSDGMNIYISDWGGDYGGVYRVHAVTGQVDWIYESPEDPNERGIYTELAVLSSSVRDLGQGSGDQIIFGRHDPNNPGGISFIVDDGNSVTGSHPLVTGDAMWQFLELDKTYRDPNLFEPNDPNLWDPNDPNYWWDPNGTRVQARVMSAAADPNGVIYLYDAETYGMYQYDQLGRLVCLNSKAQQNALNRTFGGVDSGVQGGMLQIQPRDANHPETGETITQLMYRSYNKWVAGLYVFRPGDFTRDGVIDANDTSFFIAQLETSRDANGDPNELPTYWDGETYLDYLKADLNGSAQPLKDGTYLDRLEKIAVTIKDLEVLLQFLNLWQGDLDWDGDVDATDQSTLNGNLGMANPIVFDGDLDCDGDVDARDQSLLAANLGTTYDIDPGEGVRGGGYPEKTLTLTVQNDHMGTITVTPPPRDPNTWSYPWLTEVMLNAHPIEGKSFKQWDVMDPNHPGDPFYAESTIYNPIQVRLSDDMEVQASFKCGSGVGATLPALGMMLGCCGLASWRRRRK